jgi:RNA polymerase sigma-70 factor (ECF subfamily)
MRDLPPQELKDILNQIGQGDDKAFTRLYRHYHGFVYAYLRHRMADEDAAEEVAHDVFLAVCHRPQSYGGTAKFSTWLCGIANNKAADWGRKRRRAVPVAEIEADALQAIADPDADFIARLEEGQSDQAVRDCVDALPDAHREAVFWAYYEEADMETIAAHQGCPVGTVKSRLANARKKLMDCLARQLGGQA